MNLEQIEAKLKECEQHNTKLAERREVYAERLHKTFGVKTSDELKVMLADAEKELSKKNAEYDAAMDKLAALMKEAGLSC